MGRRVVRVTSVAILGMILVLAGASSAQKRRQLPTPPPPAMPKIPDAPPKTQESPKARMNIVEMEREAKELSQLAASIPGDVDLLKKNLLPKDVIDKLKRIEKLSRHLRGEIVF